MPKRKVDEDAEGGVKKATKGMREQGEAFLQQVWNVELPEAEYDGSGGVRIYDDCNEVRRKITAFLKKYAAEGVTQTALLRLLGVNSNSFGRFMKLHGPCSGAENNMYASGYEFFEKLRLYEKKPKSAKRLTAEKDFASGYEQKDISRTRFIVSADSLGPTQMDVMLARAREREEEEKLRKEFLAKEKEKEAERTKAAGVAPPTQLEVMKARAKMNAMGMDEFVNQLLTKHGVIPPSSPSTPSTTSATSSPASPSTPKATLMPPSPFTPSSLPVEKMVLATPPQPKTKLQKLSPPSPSTTALPKPVTVPIIPTVLPSSTPTSSFLPTSFIPNVPLPASFPPSMPLTTSLPKPQLLATSLLLQSKNISSPTITSMLSLPATSITLPPLPSSLPSSTPSSTLHPVLLSKI